MTYPPSPPPADRLNTTPQVTNHPSDHNLLSENITDIVNELGTNPSGDSPTVEARFDQMLPVGTIFEFGGQSPPTGNWLLCDGQSVSTTGIYAALFAVIGYNFGGAGSAFRLPDFRGKSAVGADTGGAGVGATGGNIDVKKHVHTGPEHTHTVDDHTHDWSGTITNNVTRRTTGAPIGDTSSALRVVVSNNNQSFENGRMSATADRWTQMPASPSGQGNHVPAISTRLSIDYGSTVVSGTTDPKALTSNKDGTQNTGNTGDGNDNYHPYTKVTKIIKY